MKKVRSFYQFGILFLVLFVLACAPKEFSPFEQKVYTTQKTLEAAIEFRDLGLRISGNLYKQGLLKETDKEKIIDIGDKLYNAIVVSQEALETYYLTGNSVNLNEKLILYAQIYGKFSDLIMPYILKHYEEKNNG